MFYFSDNFGGYVGGKKLSVDEPCVTVMAAGMGGDSLGHWVIDGEGNEVCRPPADLLTREPKDSPIFKETTCRTFRPR